MKYMSKAVLLAMAVVVAGCTENIRSRKFGGTSRIDLPAGEKLVTMTWKKSNLWYLTRVMKEGESAERYVFRESSNWGALEGKVLVQEHAR